jgi:hypothetical protein
MKKIQDNRVSPYRVADRRMIIGIIAAITYAAARPMSGQRRRSAPCAPAALMRRSRRCGGGGYAITLLDLATAPTAGGPAFIPGDLAVADVTPDGYLVAPRMVLAAAVQLPATPVMGWRDIDRVLRDCGPADSARPARATGPTSRGRSDRRCHRWSLHKASHFSNRRESEYGGSHSGPPARGRSQERPLPYVRGAVDSLKCAP